MSDEFTTNENGSKTPEETNFQDYTAPENEIDPAGIRHFLPAVPLPVHIHPKCFQFHPPECFRDIRKPQPPQHDRTLPALTRHGCFNTVLFGQNPFAALADWAHIRTLRNIRNIRVLQAVR